MTEAESNREDRLAAVLEDLIHRSRAGYPPQWDDVGRQHPDLADELRGLWTTATLVDDFRVPIDEERGAASNGHTTSAVPREIGDYELLEELGRGGMGVVFRARQKSLGRIVALKMLLHGRLALPRDVSRFLTEAQSAARISHAHIVPVYEVGEHDGQPFFSMKYVEGTTLAKRIAEGPLPPREAAQLLIPVCRAVAEAHLHGVLHRDLKPSNILLDQQGQAHVSDFGLAKSMLPSTTAAPREGDCLTATGDILGTPSYMAPEQAASRGNPVSPATDVYSLGAILYAMLTGRAPFQAASPLDTVMMVLEQDPLPPRLLNRRSDPDLEMIALKCLQKPADLRYSSAAALADDLEAYLASEPLSARSSHFSQIVSRAFRESHHAVVLESWALLWMWHSLVLLVLCLVTNWFQWKHITSRSPYLGLWGVGLGVWAAIFWTLRRRGGPITFVERQVVHVWAGSVISSTLLFVIEGVLGLPVLTLSPVLGLISGVVFLIKAGILSGAFYIQSIALFLTAIAMAVFQRPGMPHFGLTLFGVVSAACFFFPGLKYYRQRAKENRAAAP